MCDLFGGGGTSTTTETTQLPEWLNNAAQDVYNAAETYATGVGGDFPVYDQARIAPLTEMQTAGLQIGANTATGGVTEALQARGINELNAATAPFEGISSLEQFMNPFTQGVIDPVINEISRAYEEAQIAKDDSDVAAGAFGTASRRDVYSTELEKRKVEDIGRYVSQLHLQNFNQAWDRYQQERAKGFQGAEAYQRAGALAQQLGFNSAEELVKLGTIEQGQLQQALDLRYQDFLSQFYQPQEAITWLANILTGSPSAGSGTSITTGPGANTSAGNIGAVAALLGGAGQFLGPEGIDFFG